MKLIFAIGTIMTIGFGILLLGISVVLFMSSINPVNPTPLLFPFSIAMGNISLSIFSTSVHNFNLQFLKLATEAHPFFFHHQGIFYKIDHIIEKMSPIFNKIYMIAFVAFWFEIILFCAIAMIKDQQFWSLILIIPFLLVGIFIAKSIFSKNKKS